MLLPARSAVQAAALVTPGIGSAGDRHSGHGGQGVL